MKVNLTLKLSSYYICNINNKNKSSFAYNKAYLKK